MNLSSDMISSSWLLLAYILYFITLFFSLRYFPLGSFKQIHNLFFGFCVALMVLWTIRAGVKPGLEYHYIGSALLLLLFGWQLAIIGLSLVMSAMAIIGYTQWPVLPLNLLIMAVFPVTIAYVVLKLSMRYLSSHYFVYIFIACFFNAAITIIGIVLLGSLIMVVGGTYPLDLLLYEYIPYFSLMLYPEAFITGLLMTIMTIYFPAYVHSFTRYNVSMDIFNKN